MKQLRYRLLIMLAALVLLPTGVGAAEAQKDLKIQDVFTRYGKKRNVTMVELSNEMLETYGMMRWVFELILRRFGETSTPCPMRVSSSSTNTTGSRTTPFPIRQILPSCRMPEGTRWSAAFLPSTMTVCPALFRP